MRMRMMKMMMMTVEGYQTVVEDVIGAPASGVGSVFLPLSGRSVMRNIMTD